VCRQIIDAACELEWPRGRILIQVLDDSTDEVTRERIQDAVAAWREAGVNIAYRWRSNREGYKAGAMSEAMADIKEYDHCGACPYALAFP
jgi:beta-mannan synthase